jgi:hypothetical protein
MSGRYTPEDAQDLDIHVVRDYCMALSFRSLGDLKALQGVEDKPRRDVVEHAQHQPEERAPVAASVAARNSWDAGVFSRFAHASPGPEASVPSVSCIWSPHRWPWEPRQFGSLPGPIRRRKIRVVQKNELLTKRRLT